MRVLRLLMGTFAFFLGYPPEQRCMGTDDWPQFRGGSQQGTFSNLDVPVHWGRDTKVVWKLPVEGVAWSQPVVLGGKVFLTTAVSHGDKHDDLIGDKKTLAANISLRVMCADLVTGKESWNVEVSSVPAGVTIHSKNSHASASPIAVADKVFFHFGPYGTAAVDTTGKLLWRTTLAYDAYHGSGSSPILWRDTLIVQCDGADTAFITALDSRDGSSEWRTPRRETQNTQTFSFSTPLLIAVNGDPHVVSAASSYLYAYSPSTGQELWRVAYPERYSVIPRPVFSNGFIFACTGFDGPAEILAVRPDGTGDVTDTHVVWKRRGNVSHTPSPVVVNDLLFMVSDEGVVTCRELAKGNILWAQRIGGNYSASPIASENRVYFLSEEGHCTVISAKPTFEKIGEGDLAERCLASPVPIHGGLLIRTESGLYRIGE